MKKSTIIEIFAFSLILLFVYAAFSKVLDLEKFRIQIGQSPLLTKLQSSVSIVIPLVEIVCSMMLAIPKYRLVGFALAFGLMSMFNAYIISILQFSEHIPCACGGVLQFLGWKRHLLFNCFFGGVAAAGFVLVHSLTRQHLSEKKT
ncbi:MAG TPA: MauE/DoxX family redox-associated membrane protein [Cyclobacteriaceae bacterium]|nr:MauE/DoxX family redox-associated membrane protein [Cyclobacteriaceae bacterium]